MGILEDVMKALERIPAWKRLQAMPEQVTALEARIAALEQQLKPASGEKCPSCGAMAFKLLKSELAKGALGRLGARDYHYTCSSCQYSDVRATPHPQEASPPHTRS
jgi:transposase-like protein